MECFDENELFLTMLVLHGGLFSAVKQNIHFCLIPSSEFLPATSQFPVREISGSFLETPCEFLGTFDLRFRLSPPFEQNKQTIKNSFFSMCSTLNGPAALAFRHELLNHPSGLPDKR